MLGVVQLKCASPLGRTNCNNIGMVRVEDGFNIFPRAMDSRVYRKSGKQDTSVHDPFDPRPFPYDLAVNINRLLHENSMCVCVCVCVGGCAGVRACACVCVCHHNCARQHKYIRERRARASMRGEARILVREREGSNCSGWSWQQSKG